jgi:hypothetical protein
MTKIKKIVLTTIIVFFIIGLFIMPANAALGWYTCNVKGIGIGAGQVLVQLEDASQTPAFGPTWFTPQAGSEKMVLAAALSAQSQGLKVLVYCDPATVDQATRFAYTFYVMAEGGSL